MAQFFIFKDLTKFSIIFKIVTLYKISKNIILAPI